MLCEALSSTLCRSSGTGAGTGSASVAAAGKGAEVSTGVLLNGESTSRELLEASAA